MNVRELIERLQELNGELEVYAADSTPMLDEIAPVNHVWTDGADYVVIEYESRYSENSK